MNSNQKMSFGTPHKHLSSQVYRKVVLDKGTFERQSYGCCLKSLCDPQVWVANPNIWSTITEKVPPHMECTNFTGYNNKLYCEHKPRRIPGNHPMVEKGIAFWLTENILITGYTLKNNPKIYRPIFQVNKEQLNFELRIQIKYFAKFIVAQKRQAIYRNTIINAPYFINLPIELIDKIALLTYDPLLLI